MKTIIINGVILNVPSNTVITVDDETIKVETPDAE